MNTGTEFVGRDRLFYCTNCLVCVDVPRQGKGRLSRLWKGEGKETETGEENGESLED